MIRCKCKCNSLEKRIGWGEHPFHYSYTFHPVSGGSEENKRFYAATPGGQLQITAVKEDHFEVGKEYYFDIHEAPPTE